MDTRNRRKPIYLQDKKAFEQACDVQTCDIKLSSSPLTFCQVLREAAHFSNRGQTTRFTLAQVPLIPN